MNGKHVVYVENRNGNSAAHILQDETFKRMAELLEQEGINIKFIRADFASYGFEIINSMRKYAQAIFVRARMNASIEEAIAKIETWEKINAAGQEMYRSSTLFTPFKKVAKEAKYTQPVVSLSSFCEKTKGLGSPIKV